MTQEDSRQSLNEHTTRVELENNDMRLSVAGPALAVVAIVALLGIIYLGACLINLSEKAIAPRVNESTRMTQ